MEFWIFMLGVNLLIPLTMILGGRRFMRHPPKTIQALYGYRTARSMKNRDTWDFAHRHCGKVWFRTGLALLPASLAAMLLGLGWDTQSVGNLGLWVCMVQTAVLVLSIFPTEAALRRTFDKDGRRKPPEAGGQ